MYLEKKKKKRNYWWIPNYHFTPPEKSSGDVNYYSYGEFTVMKCPECKHAWERGVVGKTLVPVYYYEFPTYKLKEVTCPKCGGDNENS